MGRHVEQMQAPRGTAAHLHPHFWVVTAIINTPRYRSRYELYNDFARHMAAQGAQLVTVEAAFGDRAHALTCPGNPRHIQLRTRSEVWLKEALLNLAIGRLGTLDPEWRYVAWIDSDLLFARPDLVNETVQRLQQHPVVQMFSEAYDLGPDYQILKSHESFGRSWSAQRPAAPALARYPYPGSCEPPKTSHYHPGFAWAARREAIDGLGQLVDVAALGAGDYHMAWALVGDVDRSIHPGMTRSYRRYLKRWESRAERHVHRNVGYVPGTVLHHWHGKKADRKYWDRWRILVENHFDPETDLKRDWQGLYQLVDHGDERSRRLRDGMRGYFSERNEDSVDV